MWPGAEMSTPWSLDQLPGVMPTHQASGRRSPRRAAGCRRPAGIPRPTPIPTPTRPGPGRRRGWTRPGGSRLEAGDLPEQAAPLGLGLAECGGLHRAGVLDPDRPVDQRQADAVDVVAADEDRSSEGLLSLTEGPEPDGLRDHDAADPAVGGDQLLVVVLGGADELELVEQVGESVGAQDHREDVGRIGLELGSEVGRQRPVGERELALERRQVGPLPLECRLRRRQARLLGRQVGFDGVEPGLHGRDLTLHEGQPVVLRADR